MRLLHPILAGAAPGDRLIAGLGAVAGIALAGIIAGRVAGTGVLLLVAPVGASAVLVFAVPASPLAQPWAVIGGNVVSALWALLLVYFGCPETLAAGMAVGGAIGLMSLLRCLHPPGGAVALGVVLLAAGGERVGWWFPLEPVGLDSALLVLTGIGFHRLSGHAYPHRPAGPRASAFAPEDVDAALADMHETFDIAREDLDALLARAAHHAGVRLERRGRSSPRR